MFQISATIGGTTIGKHWPGTVTAGKVTWDTTNALADNFNNVYGHPAGFQAVPMASRTLSAPAVTNSTQ